MEQCGSWYFCSSILFKLKCNVSMKCWNSFIIILEQCGSWFFYSMVICCSSLVTLCCAVQFLVLWVYFFTLIKFSTFVPLFFLSWNVILLLWNFAQFHHNFGAIWLLVLLFHDHMLQFLLHCAVQFNSWFSESIFF